MKVGLTRHREGRILEAERKAMHPGITMHKIPVEGWVGLLFTVGVLVMILVSLPQARWFLAISLPTGVIIGIVLRLTSRD
jgi:L-asparagine transporter-like permease